VKHRAVVHAGVELAVFTARIDRSRQVIEQRVVEGPSDESLVEHASAKDLIAQIQTMEPGDDLFDAKVKVLSEMIDHHVEEEETDMFPKVRKTNLDLEELGAAMAARKEEIQLPPV